MFINWENVMNGNMEILLECEILFIIYLFIYYFIYLIHHICKLHEKKEKKTNTHQCRLQIEKKKTQKQKKIIDYISNI